MKKAKTKAIIVQRESNIRYYTYKAYLDPKTGRIRRIVAGCRNWKNFAEVRRHYYPAQNNTSVRWSDAWVEKWKETLPEERDTRLYNRREARGLIAKLERDVKARQRLIRAKAKRGKKRVRR